MSRIIPPTKELVHACKRDAGTSRLLWWTICSITYMGMPEYTPKETITCLDCLDCLEYVCKRGNDGFVPGVIHG
jgi:hypothetical protein